MVLLTELPLEIVQHVLGYVDPPDLACVPRVCKSLHHTVQGNNAVFRAVYLNHFDKPSNQSGVNWEQILKDVVYLQVVSRRDRIPDKENELPFVYETVKSLLQGAAAATDTDRFRRTTYSLSRNAEYLKSIFREETNQSAFLCRSFIFERARRRDSISDVRHDPALQANHQKSAHLHCLYGAPISFAHPESHRTRHSKMSPYAGSKVYDLRQYTERTKWGPFMDDDTDRVDWEKVEAIMIVVGSNLRQLRLTKFSACVACWDSPFAGTWPQSYKPYPLVREPEPLELLDPYGITGTWLRVVCFLDYTNFFTYNFASNYQVEPHQPRRALDCSEATRLIVMRLRVTRIEPPGPDDGQALPVAHFEGISQSIDDSYDENANSDMRGMRGSVRLTREGEVRWTTFSVFGGVEKWRSESVQVGGVRSARGVMGNWFDRDFDPQGPAGPTAFWKVADSVEESDDVRALIRDYVLLGSDVLHEDEDEDEDEEDEPGMELEITSISLVAWTED